MTETALMADIDVNLKVLQALNALGLRVAVDDFGTGYSSLAQLTRLPVEVLKIDRAFVDGIGRKQQDVTLIRAIIGLGKALGLKLVAEGVESGEQLQTLRQLGCDLIQGYLFHRPMPLDALQSVVEHSLSAARDAAQPCPQGEGAPSRGDGGRRRRGGRREDVASWTPLPAASGFLPPVQACLRGLFI
ncbi:Bacteriophytochrome cph2 [Chromobacterium violaceum]|uniref:Bacteriophytochrome cph2 n=1 Tax=Chromobacterium violaceum TaxID=536 RepID=A0A3S4ID03_CHRVL|nr:Bacteriophytochrome cph2 [Chromobacterium violaceum]